MQNNLMEREAPRPNRRRLGGLFGNPGPKSLEQFVAERPAISGLRPGDKRGLPDMLTQPRGMIGGGRPLAFQRPEAEPVQKSNKIFGKGGAGWHVMGNMADVLLQHNGHSPIYGPSHQQRQQLEAQQAKDLSDRQWQYDTLMAKRGWDQEDEEAKRNAPQYFMSNGDRVKLDPVSGQTETLYDGQEPFEDYAQALGIEPGTPEYTKALQDYVLRGSGPTAHDYDVQLDNVRTRNDIQRKGSPTYRQANPAPRRGPSGSPGVSVKKGERTITTADGRTQVVRNGQWVDAR